MFILRRTNNNPDIFFYLHYGDFAYNFLFKNFTLKVFTIFHLFQFAAVELNDSKKILWYKLVEMSIFVIKSIISLRKKQLVMFMITSFYLISREFKNDSVDWNDYFFIHGKLLLAFNLQQPRIFASHTNDMYIIYIVKCGKKYQLTQANSNRLVIFVQSN